MNDVIRLHISSKKVLLEPIQKGNVPSLEIDRTNGRISQTQSDYGPQIGVKDIYGIIGTIKLLSGPYLLAITGRHSVGHINGAEIWKITRTMVFPIYERETFLALTPEQQEDETRYLKMIEWILSLDGFYFSYSYDLTLSLQRIYSIPDNLKTRPLWARADPRFFWNINLVKDFISQNLDAWILPILFGFVEIGRDCKINGKAIEFALISRRSNKRLGTRYYVRGIDSEGNVANAVETEQLVLLPGGPQSKGITGTSLVQTRGSIPLFWNQYPNLKYKPKPVLYGQSIETAAAIRRHFEELSKHHNKVVVINLIDQKGSELALGEGYENQVRLLNNSTKYVAFDFHHQCRKMRYDKLSTLIDQVADDQDKQGFFYVENDKVQMKQDGIFRTNCIDNLDRTNVVQGLLGRRSLEQQLQKLGVLTNTAQKITDYPPFEHFYKNVWADNADALSIQYSGTGALKTDFTRTGKRTLQGTLNDGVNSATRYILNNFYDGFRQDAFDLVLGNYVVDANSPSPFRVQKRNLTYLIAFFVIFLLALFFLMPSETTFFHQVLFVLIGLVVMLAAWRIALRYGKLIVDRPVLYFKENN